MDGVLILSKPFAFFRLLLYRQKVFSRIYHQRITQETATRTAEEDEDEVQEELEEGYARICR